MGKYVSIKGVAFKVPGRKDLGLLAEIFGPFSAVGKGIEGCENGDHNDNKDEGDLCCSTRRRLETGAGGEVIP